MGDKHKETDAVEAMQHSQERFRSLFEHSAFGVAICRLFRDDDGVPIDYEYLEVNEAVAVEAGPDAAKVVGHRVSELFPKEEADHYIQMYGQAVDSGVAARFEQKCDVFGRHFDVVAFRISGDEFAITMRDITETRKLQEQLQQSQKMDAIGRLAGGVAHDYSNIVMGIMYYAELCRDGIASDHPIQQWVDEIQREAERSASLTRQLLGFARQLKRKSLLAAHRLDKDTSGCIIVACNQKVFDNTVQVFKEHKVSKTYHAIVFGKIRLEHQTIREQIEGRDAVSSIKIIDSNKEASHISVRIKTGRTHQIRKHLSSIRNPVIGDKQYAVGRKVDENAIQVARQMLHASSISFPHPDTGRVIRAHAPLPKDFRRCLRLFKLR
ncbi:hypothetical protein BVX97_03785 [bacterium E08(2017)]|nr:hypothetical protein BVX97_03785 [bacterium E08(2017)]